MLVAVRDGIKKVYITKYCSGCVYVVWWGQNASWSLSILEDDRFLLEDL